MYSEEDLINVMRMVFSENRGNMLTEAMMFGLEHSVLFYLKAVNKNDVEIEDGTP